MALQTKGTISPMATQSPPWGLSMLFQPGAKPFAAAHGRKNSGACFLYNLPVYKAMAAVLLPPEASPAIWGRPQHEKARQP
jgi:hypothetical protein